MDRRGGVPLDHSVRLVVGVRSYREIPGKDMMIILRILLLLAIMVLLYWDKIFLK